MNKYHSFLFVTALLLISLLGQYVYSNTHWTGSAASFVSHVVGSLRIDYNKTALPNATKECYECTTPSHQQAGNIGYNLKYILSLTFDAKSGIPKVENGKTENKPDRHTVASVESLASREVPGVDCSRMIEGNKEAAKQGLRLYKDHSLQPEDYLKLTGNCSDFRLRRGYVMEATEEERDFPIAFSILTYKDLEQTERLLRAIYRPHNIYCIHLERTSEAMYRALQAITSCLPNVVLLSKRFHVARYLMSVIQPELECMRLLWREKLWKYFINLTGQEFPLATNLEMVRALKSMGERNVIYGDLMKNSQWEWRVKHKFNGFKETSRRKEPPPHNITLYRGPVHVGVTRAFVEAILHNQKVDDFLGWLLNTRTPDATFFATLNFNAHLGIRGAFDNAEEARDTVSKMQPIRFKQFAHIKRCPKNRIAHEICIIGTGLLPDVVQSGAMFANKFHADYERVAYACLEQWHYNKILKELSRDMIDDVHIIMDNNGTRQNNS